MNNTLKYILVGALVFALVFFVALPFFGANAAPWAIGCGWNRGGGAWGMGSGMMRGGWGFPGMTLAPAASTGVGGFGLFGGLMMLGMFLYPLLILGLIAAGVYWLVKTVTKSKQQ
jgi:hypothetical protein